MAPKFRGGSDDWLDDEDTTQSRPAAKKAAAKGAGPAYIAMSETNAMVIEVFPKQCRVKFDSGAEAACAYRRAKIFGARDIRERAPVAVGDRVQAVPIPGGDEAVMEGL